MVLIQAVRGLGVSLVEGRVSPEVILVPRSIDPSGIARTPSAQGARTVPDPSGGLREEPLSPEEAALPAVSDDEAVELVRRTQKATISHVQRHLRIGYNRAARIIEDMEREGIIGPQDGTRPRAIF